MNKNILLIALCAATAILLYLLLSDPKQPDSHATDHAMVQADNKIILAQRDAGLRKIDSLEKAIVKRDSLIDKQKTELAIYRRDLDKSTVKAVQLAKEIRILKQQDTTELGRKADSLANEALNFAWLYEQYKAHSDSLAVLIDSNKVSYETALNEQRRLYDELYRKYEQLYRLYNVLFKDHQHAGKKLRREKLKTKVGVLLGVATGLFIPK